MSRLFLGLISGTSADGIDAALVQFPDDSSAGGLRLRAACTRPWSSDLRQRLVAIGQGGEPQTLDELGRLDVQVAQAFADAALALLDDAGVTAAQVAAIGSHGQTLRHRPHGDAPFTMQIGDGSVIAERTGIATVADFRRRDVAAGGQGAPLVPAFHQAVFGRPDETVAALNIGGISNLSILPAAHAGPVTGFDCGPGNALMDAWCQQHTGQPFDRDGAWAASGQVIPALLQSLLQEPFLAAVPPKSTGRDLFNTAWLQQHLQGFASAAPADVQATLTALTAQSCCDALLRFGAGSRRLVLCGGGTLNAELVRRLQQGLPGVRVESSAAHGLPPLEVEAAAFAWLAHRMLHRQSGSLASVTGARADRVLGALYPA